MSRGRKRTPSDEEEALWQHVTRSVAPLRPQLRKPAAKPAEPVAPASRPRTVSKPAAPAPAKAKAAPPPALHPIDRRTMSRLGRGVLPIDARIDLHGMTQARAHDRLIDFLLGAQASGARLVLVITGKGRAGERDERGVLRRLVPTWLSTAELRPLVIGFDEAGRAHGGEGALYVRLRRRKEPGGPPA